MYPTNINSMIKQGREYIAMEVLQYLNRRVLVLTGHYGSGKTELAINLARYIRQRNSHVALIDLDIANPYFRSREKMAYLAGEGIEVISNAYDFDITADLPALSSRTTKYLASNEYRIIVDAGGNDSGARILNQYRSTLIDVNACILAVVNAYRPETDSTRKIIGMVRSIEKEVGLKIDGIVNNSNLLGLTQSSHVADSVDIIKTVSAAMGIPIVANCCKREFYSDLTACCDNVFQMDLFMRPEWLDI